ncbi:hypothetical protein [Streptomyces narbonensis]|uniref:hypothetical protein n=1 Tax=Streptomyces narbonensis TaxID=67333 RepID=UPI0033DF9AC4
MAYVARIVQPSGRTSTREVPSAENGALQIFILLSANGWNEDQGETVARLVSGESISHKGFTYSVSEK